MSDTVRIIGFEGDVTLVQAIKPTSIADTTPVLSSAIDTRTYPRNRILVVCNLARTNNGVTFSVTESATSGGTYAAATTSGTLTKLSLDGVRYVTVQRNAAKPFIKVTATGDNGTMACIASASVLFIADTI